MRWFDATQGWPSEWQLPAPPVAPTFGLEHVRERRARRMAFALEARRELLGRRIHLLDALEDRMLALLGEEHHEPERPRHRMPHRPQGSARRAVLDELFARIPESEYTRSGYPRLGYVNAVLEEQGLNPLESTAKLRGEYDRWSEEAPVG